MTEDTWRTDDMALAAFLLVEFNEPPELAWEMETCYFTWDEPDEAFLEAVQEFFTGKAKIEPRAYNMAFAKLKKAVFNHPDAPQVPSWRRHRATA